MRRNIHLGQLALLGSFKFALTLSADCYHSRLRAIRANAQQYPLGSQGVSGDSISISNIGSASRKANSNGLRQAVANISQANAIIEIAGDKLNQVDKALTRMRALTVQAG